MCIVRFQLPLRASSGVTPDSLLRCANSRKPLAMFKIRFYSFYKEKAKDYFFLSVLIKSE
ncbi:hypothetical protein GCM10010995_21400 [Cysteiniphilum litorale]|uniref:Uncharacterized protein n=1 Tax=Cysteiniphilum litorale TaxID=2056700 RepID=A0A8J3E916_9GAMM|nr:hypothetical protein GCM10010995_21400 [Cysteiniphilum litorale]